MALPGKYKVSDNLIGWLAALIDSLGTIVTQNANNVAITGGSVTGLSAFTGPEISSVSPGEDLNNITRNGWYRFDGATANTPTSNGIVLHMARTDAIWAQLALTREGNPRAWIRRKNSAGTISAWEQVATLTEAQTFTNKTISGGTFSGTIGGNPTYSGIFNVEANTPASRWSEIDQSSGNQRWDIVVAGGVWNMRAVADDSSTAATWLAVTRSGVGISTVNFPNGIVQSGSRDLSLAANRDVTQATVANTVTETTVYSFSVPAATLSTNRYLKLDLIGDHLNNSGSADTLTIRVKFGGTTIATLSLSYSSNANRAPIMLESRLSAFNATNAQAAVSQCWFGAAGALDGSASLSGNNRISMNNSLAVDSTSAQTLSVTVQHGTADSNISFRAHTVQLMLV